MKWGGVGGQICFLALSVIFEFHFCVCLYDVPWALSFYVHIIAEKSFLLIFLLAISF